MRRSAPAVVTALLAVLALTLAGCTSGSGTAEVSSTPPADKVLKLAFLQDPGQPPDPDVFYAGQGLVLTENLYEGLLQYAPGTDEPTLAPSLATDWQANSDNTVFTLNLRSGVTFHDGTPFDSSAVKPSFDRRLAVGQGPSYMVSQVKSVETPSPTQVVITLNAPDPAFLSYLASPYGPRMMSPTALAANAGSDNAQTYLATHDVGTGPYELSTAKVGEEYALKAYPGYWGDEPYFTEVTFPVLNDLSALQVQFNSGDLHAILYGLNSSASTSYQGSTAVTNYSLPALQTEQVYVNPNKGFLTTAANRTALLQAIDYEKIREQVYGGRSAKATGNYPANLLPEGASPQDLTYDTSALSALVSSLPADQKSLTVGYVTSDADEQVVANLIATELQALGLTVSVQGLTTSQVFGFVGTDGQQAPNIYIASAWPDSAEAYAWAHIIYDGSGGLNYLSCSDPALTDAIAKASTVSSEADPATWGAIGEQALATGCWANLAYRQDFMVGQKWLTGVEEAHVVTAPTSLLLAKLGVSGS